MRRLSLVGAFLLILFLLLPKSLLAYYWPPSNVPPGPPPNYYQIDTTYFLGAPSLPLPPPDSGGIYIWYDQGKWNIANHIYSKGKSYEQFHCCVLVCMSQPPTPGVNVFTEEFELWADTSNKECLKQNDRWGWKPWGENLYEIWWDVTTREWKDSLGDPNDFMKLIIVGAAVDFNLWSSGHGVPFGADQVYLGANMTSLDSIPGFYDWFPGISDPYQSQAGSNPSGDPNITIFTQYSDTLRSYNANGLIDSTDSYTCDLAVNYGDRYAGTFADTGNGVQFSTNGVCQVNNPPYMQLPPDTSVFLCVGDSFCIDIFASDPDPQDTITVEKIFGAGDYTPVTDTTPISDIHCFFPNTSGSYMFIFKVTDDGGLSDIDTTIVTVDMNDPPTITLPADIDTFMCTIGSICIKPILASDPDVGDTFILTKVEGPGTFVPDTAVSPTQINDTLCFTPADKDSIYRFIFKVEDGCGATDFDTMLVKVDKNEAPTLYVHSDTTFNQCAAESICFNNIYATDPDTGDTVTIIKVSGPGVYNPVTGEVCFLPQTKDTTYEFVFKATDSCGLFDQDTTYITVNTNQVPQVIAPIDTIYDLCSADTICFKITLIDPDDGLTVNVSPPGVYHPSDSTVCFWAYKDTIYSFIIDVHDSCGASDADTNSVTVNMNDPPVVTVPADFDTFLCNADSICFDITIFDPDDDLTVEVNNPFSYNSSDTSVCFLANTETTYCCTVIVTDSCQLSDTGIVCIDIDLNDPPVVTVPADFDTFLCNADSICFDITIFDPDDSLVVEVNDPFSYNLSDTSVCFFANTEATYCCTVTVTDSCGMADTGVVCITVDFNAPPLLILDDDTSYHLCAVTESLCFEGHIWDDEPNPFSEVSIIEGAGSLDQVDDTTFKVCFLPATFDSIYVFVLQATDTCQETSTDTIEITVDLNDYPVVTLPEDTSVFMCSPENFCIQPIIAYDPDSGNTFVLEKVEGPGVFVPDTGVSPDTIVTSHCFTPADKDSTYRFIFKVTNGCGAEAYDTIRVTVDVNQPPTVHANVASDTVEFKEGFEKCFDVIGDDPDTDYVDTLKQIEGPGDFQDTVSQPQLIGRFCWTPTIADTGIHRKIFRIIDHCGEMDEDTVWINVTPRDTCIIDVDIAQIEPGVNPGEIICLPINLQTEPAIGGFKFLIEWDPNVLTLLGVERGDCIDDIDFWLGPHSPHYRFEKFYHEQLPCTDIHKKKVKLVGIADMPDGYQGYPIPESTICSIACLKFQVKNDATLKGYKLPVKFEWDPGIFDENTLTDPTGYIWYVSQDPNQFPYDTSGPNVEIEKVVCFTDGGIRVDDTGVMWRGDVNLNEYPYEIADAVCFANYFITGYLCTYDQVSDYWYDISINATDVNADGIVLSIADLVYFIRIILEMEAPIVGKPAPVTEVASLTATVKDADVVVSSNCDVNIGAAAFVFKHSGVVTEVENFSNMELKWNDANGELRVLLWSQKADFIPAGASDLFGFKSENVELVGVEAADNMGMTLKGNVLTKMVPKEFVLKGNYPNPFNPKTHISFVLPDASSVNLEIYNISGQLVKNYKSYFQAGSHTITWDGTNRDNEVCASGVYFYKIEAGKYTDTKKMLLVK